MRCITVTSPPRPTAVGRAKGLAHGTVRKHAHAESFPERAAHGPGPSRLDPHLAHFSRRTAEGCKDAVARFARGAGPGPRRHALPGSQGVNARRRTGPAPRTARQWLGRLEAARGPGGRDGGAARLQGARPRMLMQPVAALPRARAPRSPAPCGTPRRPGWPVSHGASPRSCAAAAPARTSGIPIPGTRPRGLDRGGADLRHRPHGDVRRGARARRRRRARRAEHAVEPQAGRGPDHPPQAHRAPVLGPRRLRAPAPPRPPCPPTHSRRRRAAETGRVTRELRVPEQPSTCPRLDWPR